MDTSDTSSASIKKAISWKEAYLCKLENLQKLNTIWISNWNGVGLWRTTTRLRGKKKD